MELLENATDRPVFDPYLFVSGLAWEPAFLVAMRRIIVFDGGS